jgi:cation transport regulator ChaC
MALVFQYGSNCSDAEINSEKRLRGDAKFVGIASVDDFELTFDVESKNRGCAASDIVTKPGSKVWGVLYEIPDELIDRKRARAINRTSLDQIEGEGGNYQRRSIDVRREDGVSTTAITYTVSHPKAGLATGIEYVRAIVSGLRERNVAEDYISEVKARAIESNPKIEAEVKSL